MKLSIIIPYYNTEEYTNELLKVLDNQITNEVEVILIDDGSDKEFCPKYEWLTVIRTNNQGQSKARNLGINSSVGEYIQFIDSDDMVSTYFVSKLLEKIPEGNDLIEYSWQHINGRSRFIITSRNPNISACTRCFKRSYIGDVRFNESKDATEDEDFARHLGFQTDPVSVSIITNPMYFYRKREGSTEDRFKNGLTKTKRIVYFYYEVKADREDILEEIKEEDKMNQVLLMTAKNEIPELKKYCQVIKPCHMWAHIKRGEPFSGITVKGDSNDG